MLSSLLAAAVLLGFSPPLLRAQPTEAGASARKESARRHFELGLAHFDRQEWHAAAVEFLASRDLFVTKANTKNAATCLRKIGRYDDALTLFEALLAEFPDLPESDRELAAREVTALLSLVGSLDIVGAPDGARVAVDGIERGATPLPRPVRVTGGSHELTLVRDGFLPLKVRVDVAGGQRTLVSGRLVRLTRAGRLRVVERTGRALDVVVDGAPVGSTPWEGALGPGTHTVWLRGPDLLGTPPQAVLVSLDRLSSLELTATRLPSTLAVRAEPAFAQIELDRVPVGDGRWEGRLAAGRHRVTVKAPGHETVAREVSLSDGERAEVVVPLELSARGQPRLSVALEASVVIGISWGGTFEDACHSPCSASLPLGAGAQLRAAYAFPSRLGLGAHAGYLELGRTFRNRDETLYPVGLPTHSGTVRDRIVLGGLVLGAHAEYTRGERWRFAGRLLAGAFLATQTHWRGGVFADSAGAAYSAVAARRGRASYVYAGPELTLGRRVFEQVELAVGARLLAFASLGRTRWGAVQPDGPVRAGRDGGGYFRWDEPTGDTLLVVAPTFGATYTF